MPIRQVDVTWRVWQERLKPPIQLQQSLGMGSHLLAQLVAGCGPLLVVSRCVGTERTMRQPNGFHMCIPCVATNEPLVLTAVRAKILHLRLGHRA